MKHTKSLSLVVGASAVVVAAALGLAPAHAQAPAARPAPAPGAPPSYPAATPVGSAAAPAATRPAYPAAQPVSRAPAPIAAPAKAPAKAADVAPSATGGTVPPVLAPAPGPAAHVTTSHAMPPGHPGGPPKLTPAPAPAPAAPGLPAPPEELLSFFKGAEGVWHCDGKMPAGAMGPDSQETAYKSTVKLKRDLGGFWMAGDYEIKKSKLTPGAQARFFIGYEPKSKQFVSAAFDSLGGMDRGGSPGVQGNALSLTGTGSMNGTKVQTRSTLTFVTPGKELDYKFELDRGQGFQVVGEDICKKGGGLPGPIAPGAAGGVGAPSALAKEPKESAKAAPAEAPKAK